MGWTVGEKVVGVEVGAAVGGTGEGLCVLIERLRASFSAYIISFKIRVTVEMAEAGAKLTEAKVTRFSSK